MERLTTIAINVSFTVIILGMILAVDRCNEREATIRRECINAGNDPISCRESTRGLR